MVHALRRGLRGLGREGIRNVTTFKTAEDVEGANIERQRLWTDRRDDHGPFDVIGDVHGCFDELSELLTKLGYVVDGAPEAPRAHHPEGRRAVFLGDLVDRGPDSPRVLRLVMSMVGDTDDAPIESKATETERRRSGSSTAQCR